MLRSSLCPSVRIASLRAASGCSPRSAVRTFATSRIARRDELPHPFSGPRPPPLPPKEQREFEALLKEKSSAHHLLARRVAFRLACAVHSLTLTSTGCSPRFSLAGAEQSPFSQNAGNDPEEGELHPDARRKPQPDFEGETNPITGEVGGPKKDPLSWENEWTYGGRATDF